MVLQRGEALVRLDVPLRTLSPSGGRTSGVGGGIGSLLFLTATHLRLGSFRVKVVPFLTEFYECVQSLNLRNLTMCFTHSAWCNQMLKLAMKATTQL